jgi:hypothetical protein
MSPTMSWIRSSFIDTSPDETVKSIASKLATPLFDALASSAATVIDVPVCVTSTPSPPRIEILWAEGVRAPVSVVIVLTTVSSSSTCPDVVLKSSALKDAAPLLVVEASSEDTVIVLSVTTTSIPSPPVT